ncbi:MULTISPECIES: hypothetical protein [unclassified Empedobacter]|uniref:hypothetical protein n=1 Tax=unclassified Empedobacter TaxID=2643773 RepID=UPI0025C5CEF2|nr:MULTISPECIES: hypothetical protein [unclassified Empedobacter]
MRDPKRIKPLLERIEKIWIETPDYRLGQLIMVIARTGEHNPKLFNLEESELLKKLDEFEKTQNIK